MNYQVVDSVLPFMAVFIPLLGAIILCFLKDDKKVHTLTVAVTALAFVAVALMSSNILAGKILVHDMPTGLRIDFSFFADSLSYITGLISTAVWMLCTIYAVEYMAKMKNQKRYNFFSLLSLTGMMGVIFTKNLFTLYIFFELICMASCVMVIHFQTEEVRKSARIYLFIAICGGLIMLCVTVATYALTGTGDLIKLASDKNIYSHGLGVTKALKLGGWLLPLLFFGFCFGFGAKAGLFPVHLMLPVADPISPAPAAALLSGVMIKCGAYGIIRVVYVVLGAGLVRIEPHKMSMVLLVLACCNIFLGSAIAIRQTDLWKMLAYSSVSQIGYILLGISLLTPLGLTGSIVHIFNHAMMKGCLFLCAGAYMHKAGVRDLESLKGIGARMPLTTICFTLAALSMVGFPPFTGFITKWFIGLGALEVFKITGTHPFGVIGGISCVLVLMLSGYMNLVYYGPVVYNAWFPNTDDPEWQKILKNQAAHRKLLEQNGSVGLNERKTEDPGWMMLAPMLIIGFGNLFFGIFPGFPVKVATLASKLLFLH